MPLGCAEEYSVAIMRQPGTMTEQAFTPAVVGHLEEIVSLDWGRLLNGISKARVTVTKCPSNCSTLTTRDARWSSVDPWAHELWIYRDGKIAWMGPIVYIRETPDAFHFEAHDMIEWVNRREIINYYTNTNDAASIAYDLIQTFFPPSDPDLLQHVILLTTAIHNLTVEWDRAQYVILQKWQDLLSAGLNYTTLARYILLTGQETPNLNFPFLIHADNILGDVEILKDGINYGDHVVGLGEGNTFGTGPTAADELYYGKVTYPPTRFNDVRSDSQLQDLTLDLYDSLRNMTPQLVVPAGSALSPDTDIFKTGYSFDFFTANQAPPALVDLIPGYRYDVQVGDSFCHQGSYPMRLGELAVSWTAGAGEKIAVSLTTLGVQP